MTAQSMHVAVSAAMLTGSGCLQMSAMTYDPVKLYRACSAVLLAFRAVAKYQPDNKPAAFLPQPTTLRNARQQQPCNAMGLLPLRSAH